jgi:PKD repeat protein
MGGTAALTADYSAFAMPVATDGGCTGPTGAHNVSPFTDPDFATNTFEPKWDSPLVDAGDPAATLPGGASDLNGDPRVVDGDGKGSPAAVVDIGAFEYQHRPPSVTAQTVSSAKVGAHVPFAVTKASDPDPGDTVTFTWSFDDGGSATGAHVTHPFATPGSHSATVTATDPTGLTATATVTVAVTIATRPPPPDRTPPKISKLKLKPSKFRVTKGSAHLASKRLPRGTKITFTLSEASSLELTFEKKQAGHKGRHGKCQAHGHGHRCTYYTTVRGSIKLSGAKPGKVTIVFDGHIGKHALGTGGYRLILTATDAAHNRSKPATATFTVVKRN